MSHDQNLKCLILDDPREPLAFVAAQEAGDGFADAERSLYQQTHRRETSTMSAYFDRLRAEGRQQGVSAVLLRQLHRKFGELPEAVLQRIEQADPDTLLEWSDRIITAEKIDDVLH